MTREELKQEAESKLDEWSDPDMGCCEGYCYSEVADFMFRFAEPREKQIEELEKICQDLSDKFDIQVKQVMKLEGKLTKVKELLKKYKSFIECEGLSTRLGKTYDRTGQFLKGADK